VLFFVFFFYRVFKCYLMIEKIISDSQYTFLKLFVLFPFQGGSYFACHPIDLD
jgi:predicted metalloprotease with PDZ domain